MVKINRSKTPPLSLQAESMKSNGQYNSADVVLQLRMDFHDKCYICECKPSDVVVEHRMPHKKGLYHDRKFDWNNLFLACYHCNLIKNKMDYQEEIIDCCVTDPEDYLRFELVDNAVCVKVLRDCDKARSTSKLIEDVFSNHTTAQLSYGSTYRMEQLQSTMNMLYEYLGRYMQNPNDSFSFRVISRLLDRDSVFAGFTRSYIRMHINEYKLFADRV